jgi:hypothetical protein
VPAARTCAGSPLGHASASEAAELALEMECAPPVPWARGAGANAAGVGQHAGAWSHRDPPGEACGAGGLTLTRRMWFCGVSVEAASPWEPEAEEMGPEGALPCCCDLRLAICREGEIGRDRTEIRRRSDRDRAEIGRRSRRRM